MNGTVLAIPAKRRASVPTSTNHVRVLMVGAVDRAGGMETFIERHVATLQANDIEVRHLPPLSNRSVTRTRVRRWLWRCCTPGLVNRPVRAAFREADLVHFQWPSHLIHWFPVARHFGKPIILSLRGRQINIVPHMPGQQTYVRALRKVIAACNAWHCVSKDILHSGERYGLVRERAWVIRPAIDPLYFTPAKQPPPPDPLRIAMVGALVWRKGYEYALMAFRQLADRQPNVRLTIVGDGVEHDRVSYTAQDLGVANLVALKGALNPAGVREVLQTSHLFLHASLSEGIANVALEAMACGLPVVSADVGGMQEAITNGEEGFLVRSRDTTGMAERMIWLAANSQARIAMGWKARDRAARDFNLADQGRRFVDLYRTVLAAA